MSSHRDRLRRAMPFLVAGLVATMLSACGARRPQAPALVAPLSAAGYSHYLRGRVALLAGKPKRASVEFGRAAQLMPDQPEVVVAYAEALLVSKKTTDATSVAIRAAIKWPKRFDTTFVAGSCLARQKQHNEALPYLKRAHSIEPESLDGALKLARSLVAMDQPNEAIKIYRSAIASHPSAIAPRTRLAKLYDHQRRSTKAEEIFTEALIVRPTHIGVLIALSSHLERLGRSEEAVSVLVRAVGKAIDKGLFIERLVIRLMKRADHRRVAAVLEAIDGVELGANTRLGIARLLSRAGYSARALTIANRIKSDDPTAPEGGLARADALTRLHRFKEAAEEITKLPPGLPSRVVYLAELLTLAGDTRRAIEIVQDEFATDDRKGDRASQRLHPLGLLTLSRIHELDGRVEEARRFLRNALSSAPGDDDIRFSAAAFELRAQHYTRARNYAEPLLARDRDNPTLQNFVGYCLLESGQRLDRARKLIRTALDSQPNNPNIIDSYGWLQFRKGQLTRASKTLLKAWRLAPAEPEILLHLGQVELALGRRPAAQRRFERALALATEPSLKRRIRASLGGLKTSEQVPGRRSENRRPAQTTGPIAQPKQSK